MRFKLSIFLLCLFAPALVFAQSEKPGNGVVMVVGKPMTAEDSLMVRQIFFSALREKTIENFKLATDYFARVLQLDPANDASMYELAKIRKAQSDYPGAQELLERAVTVKPDNEWYWLGLADCYEKNVNDIPKLENVFNELIRIDSDKPDYYFDKANVYFQEKKYDDALAVYKQLEQITGPTDDIVAKRQVIYLKQGNVDQAAADLEGLIAANPQQIRYYLLLGELYNSNGLADKALKVLQTAEKTNAQNGQVHLALADIYRDKKNYEASFDELSLAFAIADLDIDQEIRIVLGYIPKFPDPNAKASALELSRLLTIAHPDDSKSYALYGDILLQNEKYKDAKANYKRSVELNGQVYEVQEQLIRLELGENDPDAALKDGENALSLFPNQAWLELPGRGCLSAKKNFTKALEYIKNATTLDTQDNDLLSQSFSSLGDCYHSLNDNQKSDESLTKRR